jgi:nitroimidazol reductase NimA-like FMN-containing flavoprotein (pyridoxamine 5'-phosphate oxidase superfamily)
MGTSGDGGRANRHEILSEAACRRFLELANLGRVITSRGGLPGVFPVTYCVDDGSIFFRSTQGTSLSEISADTVVGFEVDDLDPVYNAGWTVMAVGGAREVTDPDELVRASSLRFRAVALHRAESMFRFDPDAISGQLVRPDPCETQPNSSLAPLLDESWLTR